ncbi:hypothetical protein M9435_004949 [Picochlorum sp. BPE23]|nr:hypothetical protein M9435_004949 [Picochlorum sp. BPE23]
MVTKGAVSEQEHQDTPPPKSAFVPVEKPIRETSAPQRYISNHHYDESMNVEGLAGIVDSVGSKVRQLARVLKQVEGMVSSVEMRMDGSMRERSTLQSKNDHLMKTVKGLENDVRLAQRECRDAERHVAHVQDKVEDTERDLRRLEEEYRRLEESKVSDSFHWDVLRVDLEKEVDALRAMVRVREDRVAHDARMLSALQAKVGELESEITQTKEEKDVLSQRYLAQKSELDTVLNALAQEQKDHAKSRDALQSLTATNADLNNAMREIEAAKKNVETRLELVQSDKNHVANKLEFLQMSHAKDVERSEKMLGEMKSCHAEAIACKEEELRCQKGLRDAAVADADSLRQQIISLEEKFSKEKASLGDDLEQLKGTNATLEASNAVLQASVRELEMTCDAERRKVSDLEKQMDNTIQETEEVKKRNNSLEESQGILKDRLEECEAVIKLHEEMQEKAKTIDASPTPLQDDDYDHQEEKAKRSRHASMETSVRRKIARRMKASQHIQTGATKP